ncbi:MAG: pyrrolo-quinoline quinone [Acidobacteriaceae bacterium]|nr:pyrrolo-quinoline quinone [Acidobacteriaceae bacterium]
MRLLLAALVVVCFTFCGATQASACTASSVNPSVTICYPLANQVVSSPVNVNARSTDSRAVSSLSIYIDNVLVQTVTGASANISIPVAAGAHVVKVVGTDSAGTFSSSVNITVSGSCTDTVDPSVKICVPANGATVTSPVNFIATTKDSKTISAFYVYLDNVAVQKTFGSQINTNIAVGSGTHNLRIQAWDVSGAILQAGVNVTVGSGTPPPPPPPPSTLSGMFTYHNDNGRSGQNKLETILTPANVNVTHFGKKFTRSVTGKIYAQPLYVAGVTIPNKGTFNVVYVVTEHDSVYAFDADGAVSTPLWSRSFINTAAGITPGQGSDIGNYDIGTEIGITSTPVIDPSSGTIYMVAETKENGTYVQRLHALNIATGGERSGSPVKIQATVNGSGTGGDGAGHISFQPMYQNQRPGLLLANGNVYIAWASHGDAGPYHGWVMAYNASSLQQVAVFNATRNGAEGGIWQGGAGLSADGAGVLYLSTGNGTTDFNPDFGSSYLKLNSSLGVVDYFTPYNVSALNSGDLDVGSSGALVLPTQTNTTHPYMLIGGSKNGTVYVLNRDNMGHFQSGSDSQIIQSFPKLLGRNSVDDQFFGIGSYWNTNVYFVGAFDHLKQFKIANGLMSGTPAAMSSQALASDRSAEPVVSANGASNGIVWVIATDTLYSSNPAVLHAYSASNVGTELYNSNQAGTRDQPGLVMKFSTPTVANGKVYVCTQGRLDVYGLF